MRHAALPLALLAVVGGCSRAGDDAGGNAATPVAGWGGAGNTAAPSAGWGAGSAAPPQPGGGAPAGGAGVTGDDLIRQAKAFLARPENDRDMQTALRARASTYPLLCPAVSFVPAQLVVGTTPPPIFDADGAMVKGSLRQRFRAFGCPAKPLLNVFVITAPGSPMRTISGLMGSTIADPQLQADTIPRAVMAARTLVPGCATLAPIDTRLMGEDPVTSGRPLTAWTEYWLVAGCGRYVQTTVHFTPDPANARVGIVVDSAEAKLVALPSG